MENKFNLKTPNQGCEIDDSNRGDAADAELWRSLSVAHVPSDLGRDQHCNLLILLLIQQVLLVYNYKQKEYLCFPIFKGD